MGGVSFSVHPLFFFFALYYALTGRIFVFAVYTLTAVVHELGHSLCAEKRGYRLSKIVLTPFGALLSGESDLSAKDETVIALFGPLTNLSVGVFFVATWWMFPETYAYTDVVAEANFSMFFINLLPVYPLDGGRILYSLISAKYSAGVAKKAVKTVGIIFALFLFALFIVSLFYAFNPSFLFFSLFVLAGAFPSKNRGGYVRLFSGVNERKLRRGTNVKRIAIGIGTPLKNLLRHVDPDAVNEVELYKNGKKTATLSEEEVLRLLKNGDYSKSIESQL